MEWEGQDILKNDCLRDNYLNKGRMFTFNTYDKIRF